MPEAIQVLFASLLFGLGNGLHCAGMCGPLAGLVRGGDTRAALLEYHVGRVAAYGVAGVLCGLLGASVLPERVGSAVAWVSLALGVSLVLMALGLEHFLRIPGLGAVSKRAHGAVLRLPARARGLALGAASPLLPCGLSVAVYGSAVLTGEASLGAVTLLGFALGSAVLLFVAQVTLEWLRARLGPRGMRWVSRTTILVVAVTMIWRGYLALQGASCCHA